jgi:hypothetical protein
LAVSIGAALNLLILVAVVAAVVTGDTAPGGLTDNATKILSGWGIGILAIVGALVGVNVGRTGVRTDQPSHRKEPPS